MVDVVGKRCGHQGCTKQPSYGTQGTRKREFCSQHAREGMVNLNSNSYKRCGHQGCTKHPSFGKAGTKKAESRAEHAEGEMVNLRKTRPPSLPSAPRGGEKRGREGSPAAPAPAARRRKTAAAILDAENAANAINAAAAILEAENAAELERVKKRETAVAGILKARNVAKLEAVEKRESRSAEGRGVGRRRHDWTGQAWNGRGEKAAGLAVPPLLAMKARPQNTALDGDISRI